MLTKAKIKYLKISPRKLRLVLSLVKGKTVPMALSILRNVNKKAALYAYKAVHSAAANAKRFPNIKEDNLYISKIFADGGPMLKRYKSRPMGMAAMIRKRTAHLTVELDMLTPVAVSTKSRPAESGKKLQQKKTKETVKVKGEK